MTDKRTILNLIPGQQYELRSPRGIRVSYPLGKPKVGDPKAVLTRDIGVWVEPPPVEPPPVEPPPIEPPPVTPPPTRRIVNVGADAVGVVVNANGQVIENLDIIGPGDAWSGNSRGIQGDGAFSDVVIRNCTIKGFGYGGIVLTGLKNLLIEDCIIEDCAYVGIGLLSIVGATVRRNTVRRVGFVGHQSSSHNAYGMFVSRWALTAAPCSDVTFSRNTVEDVPLWHGIDAHGGVRITVDHNTVRRCARALWMGYFQGGDGCIDSHYTNNLLTDPVARLDCPYDTSGGTDCNTAISTFKSLNSFVTGNVVDRYVNITYDDAGSPSTNLTVSGNVRGTTLP